MRRRFVTGITAAVLMSMAFFGGRATAQGNIQPWMFVQTSDGKVWTFLTLPSTGEIVRVAVPFKSATDEEVNGFRDSGGWMVPKTDGTTGLTFGQQLPEWATDRPGTPAPATAVAAPAPPPSQPSWQTVAKWSGEGSKTTEPFTVNGSQWRVQVSISGGMSDQICVSAKRLADGRLGVNDCLHGTAETYNRVGAASGTYQMDISGGFQGKWTVEVQSMQ